jgi:nucleoside phosphorylase
MKIAGHSFHGDANNPSMRKQRLEAVLSAWRFPRLIYAAQRRVPPESTSLSAEEFALWFEILRVAEPVPPRHHVEGLRIYTRLRGLRVEDLERDGAVLILRDQVAFRGQFPGLGFLGHHWSLLVPAQLEGKATEAVLQKRFQNVEVHGDEIIAWGSWEDCTDSIAPLVRDALSATPNELARLWKMSLALNVEYRFLPALPTAPAKALADLLGKELEAAADRLTAETDARLLLFVQGHLDGVIHSLPLPASRFARLLAVERFFRHARHQFSDWYYDSVARAFVRLADVAALGNALLKLEPGSALISALDAIASHRPDFIASYTFHPAFHAEGAFTLFQLQQHTVFGDRSTPIDFNEEWLEAQRLGRELLLLNDRPLDWDSLVALGIHDEENALGRRHYGVARIDRGEAQYEGAALWASAVADAERAQHYVEVLERHFGTRDRLSDAAIVFALRLLRPLRESGHAALATRLAVAIVDAYAAMLALDTARVAIPTVLPAYGDLLASLRESLDLAGETWRKFLRPFDSLEYVRLAKDGEARSGTSSDSPIFVVPRVVLAHAETLIALASAIDVFNEPLQAALELYDADRKAALNIGAFSWTALARITTLGARPVGEPLFVAIGRLFGRVAGSPPWLLDFLRNESEAHILANLAAGLGASHPLTEAIRPSLRNLVNALLAAEDGLALGHALELANVLQQAGLSRDSERLARRASQILEERLPRGAPDPYTPLARALLAGALAQQELWPDILSLEVDRNAIALSPHARFIANMRAVALMKAGRLAEAEDVMRRVLAVDATNSVALVNITALHLQAGQWHKAIEAAEHARPLLSGDELDLVLRNEALARKETGEGETVSSPSADVTSAAVDPQGAASDSLVTTEPVKVAEPLDEGIDIAIVTALPEEYDAVLARLLNVRDAPQVWSPFRNLFAWKLGEVRNHDGSGTFRVVLAQAQRSGNMETLIAAMRTIDRWSPDYLLFSGIAGGLKRDGLKQGDIVLSENIWFYENGKMAEEFRPRHRIFAPHGGLLNSARVFGRGTQKWRDCGTQAPSADHVPKCLAGLIGSGDKVIDDLKTDFVEAILKARPEIQAVEMEAAGAAAAIKNAQEEGKAVGFMMVRGISDIPRDGSSPSGAGTDERDGWKPYASAIAAHFIVSWIASSGWPTPPRQS